MASKARSVCSLFAFATVGVAACSSTVKPDSGTGASTTTVATSTTSTTTASTGAGGAHGAGGGGASGGTGAVGGWGAGGGCSAAALASPFGDPAGECATCMTAHCGALLAVCFGPGWTNGHYAGSCQDFQGCLCGCLADGGDTSGCFTKCAPRITPDCDQCTPLLSKCQGDSCNDLCKVVVADAGAPADGG